MLLLVVSTKCFTKKEGEVFRHVKLASHFQGHADPLNSAFHLTYNMVLNLLRVEEINPEYMLGRSFYQFQNYSTIPEQVESKSSNQFFSHSLQKISKRFQRREFSLFSRFVHGSETLFNSVLLHVTFTTVVVPCLFS